MRRMFLNLHPVRRNILLLLAHNGLQSMLFIIPVMVPYYRDVIHLSFSDFLLGEVAFSIVIVMMDIPAGWLADVGQRRLVLAAGSLAEMGGFILLFKARSFMEAMIAQASLGIGVGLINGTNTALLYDTLLAWRRHKHFRRLEGLRNGMGFYVVGFASLAGSFLYALDRSLPVMLGIVTFGCASVAAFLMKEPPRIRREGRRNPLRDMAETVKFALHGHKDIGALILFSGVMFGTTQAGFWTQQPYYLARGLRPEWFGMLAFAGFILAGSASQHGHRLERGLPRHTAFVLMLAGVAGCYLVAGLVPGLWAIPFLYAGSVAYGFGMPLIQDVLNGRIDSARRAGVLSTASLAGRLVFIPLGAAVAHLAALYGIDRTLMLMGLFLAVAGGGAIRLMARLGVLG